MTSAAPTRPTTPAFLALALGGFGIGVGEFVPMGLLPDIAAGLRTTVPTAGHVISSYALGVVVGAPLLAALGARLPRRTLLVVLMVAFAVGNVLSAFAPGYLTVNTARFLAGLPHGAYFGVASLLAAELAGPGRRASAVARVMLGLSVANVAGVPAATWLGQAFGWRVTFVAVAGVGVLTVAALLRYVPAVAADPDASPRRELSGARNRDLWLTLSVGAVGSGGLFAVYSYLAPTLEHQAAVPASAVPVFLAIWGTGMIAGNLVGGWAADRSPARAMLASLAVTTMLLLTFTATSRHPVAAGLTVFAVATSSMSLVPALQTRLMDVAGRAQSLAAALNHSAFNVANALGAYLGGTVLAAGYGWTSPSLAGAALAVAGIGLLGAAVLSRRSPAGDGTEVLEEPVPARRLDLVGPERD